MSKSTISNKSKSLKWVFDPAPRTNWEARQRIETCAKLAYDAYTTAAGDLDATPFCQLWPRQLAGWVAVVEALDMTLEGETK